MVQAQWKPPSQVAGGIAQSLSNGSLIMPYQGKCLVPLVMLAEFLKEPIYLEVARNLANFIRHNQEGGGDQQLIHGEFAAEGPDIHFDRRLYRLRRLLPVLEPHLRRHRQKKVTGWSFKPWPVWIARGIDTARGLHHLGHAIGEESYVKAAERLVGETLNHQTAIGGLRNTQGFFGVAPEVQGGLVWQDAAAIPRWNSYAIQFFHELAAGTPVIQPRRPVTEGVDEIKLAGQQMLIETPEELRLETPEGTVSWRLRKGLRWGRPFRQFALWNEGSCYSGPQGWSAPVITWDQETNCLKELQVPGWPQPLRFTGWGCELGNIFGLFFQERLGGRRFQVESRELEPTTATSLGSTWQIRLPKGKFRLSTLDEFPSPTRIIRHIKVANADQTKVAWLFDAVLRLAVPWEEGLVAEVENRELVHRSSNMYYDTEEPQVALRWPDGRRLTVRWLGRPVSPPAMTPYLYVRDQPARPHAGEAHSATPGWVIHARLLVDYPAAFVFPVYRALVMWSRGPIGRYLLSRESWLGRWRIGEWQPGHKRSLFGLWPFLPGQTLNFSIQIDIS